MYLIEVIPISRGITKETLSYFSSGPIPLGSLVSVSLRKKTVNGLVVLCRDARDAKSEIKASDFAMKKVSEFKSERFLSEAFIRASRHSAEYFVASVGSVLNTLIPKAVFEDLSGVSFGNETVKKGGFDRLVLQSDMDDRFAVYRSFIREEFARKRSVFFCLPTGEDAKRAFENLPKGIEQYTHLLYGSLPKKKLKEEVSAILTQTHPVLIIATGAFLSICREDLGAIVIENESSRFYKFQTRPYLDIRYFAEVFAKESGAKIVFGDTLLRTETIFRFKQGDLTEFSPIKFRSLSPATPSVVDMKAFGKNGGPAFQAVSSELGELIEGSQAQSQNVFIFCARRGLASQTVCGDCGTVVLCLKCHVPIVLHTSRAGLGNQNFFLCHSCGERRSSEERCVTCSSWKLQTLGVGIELVEQELKQKFPSLKVFRIDKDKTSTGKLAEKNAKLFYASPGSVLLGTELALPYLDKKVENTAVASLDSLFALPDFRVHEKILHILLKMRSLTLSQLLVQTRMPGERVIEYALKGNLLDFYREEIEAREMFRYPPFTTLIKISLSGTRVAVAKEMNKLPQIFSPSPLEIFPAFAEDARGTFTMHALLRIPEEKWIDQDLLKKLLTLPPQFRIEVDPESLL